MNEREKQLQKYYKDYKKSAVGLVGIGGWLALLMVGRFASIVMEAVAIFRLIAEVKKLYLTNAGITIYVLSGIFCLIHIGLEASIIALMLLRKLFFRIMFIVMISFMIFSSVGYPLILSAIYKTPFTFDPNTIVFLVAAVPWIIYLFVSERVKNTFPSKLSKPMNEEDNLGFSNPSGG